MTGSVHRLHILVCQEVPGDIREHRPLEPRPVLSPLGKDDFEERSSTTAWSQSQSCRGWHLLRRCLWADSPYGEKTVALLPLLLIPVDGLL